MMWDIEIKNKRCPFLVKDLEPISECLNKANLAHICKRENCPIKSKIKVNEPKNILYSLHSETVKPINQERIMCLLHSFIGALGDTIYELYDCKCPKYRVKFHLEVIKVD